MPQSLSNILLHLIFSTKDRQPWLKPGIRTATHAFFAGTVRQCGCEAYRVGGVEDHVHIAIRFSRTEYFSGEGWKPASAKSFWMTATSIPLSACPPTSSTPPAFRSAFLCLKRSIARPACLSRVLHHWVNIRRSFGGLAWLVVQCKSTLPESNRQCTAYVLNEKTPVLLGFPIKTRLNSGRR